MFVSRPTLVAQADLEVCHALDGVLRTLGFESVTVGVNHFGNDTPLSQVRSVMAGCHGAVTLGLRQMAVASAIMKPDTPSESTLTNFGLVSPWNQIETAMAYAMDLPLLIVKGNVLGNGIFDAAAVDSFIHEIPARGDWVNSPQLSAALSEWASKVRDRLVHS